MSNGIRIPDEFEEQIIRENGIDPGGVGVAYRSADCIRLLCWATRDIIVIFKGDRKW